MSRTTLGIASVSLFEDETGPFGELESGEGNVGTTPDGLYARYVTAPIYDDEFQVADLVIVPDVPDGTELTNLAVRFVGVAGLGESGVLYVGFNDPDGERFFKSEQLSDGDFDVTIRNPVSISTSEVLASVTSPLYAYVSLSTFAGEMLPLNLDSVTFTHGSAGPEFGTFARPDRRARRGRPGPIIPRRVVRADNPTGSRPGLRGGRR